MIINIVCDNYCRAPTRAISPGEGKTRVIHVRRNNLKRHTESRRQPESVILLNEEGKLGASVVGSYHGSVASHYKSLKCPGSQV